MQAPKASILLNLVWNILPSFSGWPTSSNCHPFFGKWQKFPARPLLLCSPLSWVPALFLSTLHRSLLICPVTCLRYASPIRVGPNLSDALSIFSPYFQEWEKYIKGTHRQLSQDWFGMVLGNEKEVFPLLKPVPAMRTETHNFQIKDTLTLKSSTT